MQMMKRAFVCLLLLTATGCGRRVSTNVAVPPPPIATGPWEYDIAYQDGLKAFREGTPEGYQHAVMSFRKAAQLETTNCAYPLHLAESLYFLAQQQKLNWEDFSAGVTEANTILQFKDETRVNCDAFESYTTRLQALRGTLTGARSAEIVALMTRAIELDGDDPMNWLVLSQWRGTPLPGQNVPPILRAAELAPDLPIVQYELGNYYLTSRIDPKNDVNNARKAFVRALELNPRHFLAIIGQVYTLSTESDAAQIESLLKKAVEIAPTSLKARQVFGDYYSGFEESEKAVAQYKAATDLNSKYYPGFLAAGLAYITADESGLAQRSFETVIALDVTRPQPPLNTIDYAADAQAHYNLGNIWLERSELVKARSEFEAAKTDLPKFPEAIYGLGIVSYQERKLDEALHDLDQVIELGGLQYPNAFLVRGGIRADRRQYVEALKDIATSIDIYRSQAAALDLKAKADEAKGFKRRAEGQRRRKVRIESTLEKAEETRKAVETLMRGGANR